MLHPIQEEQTILSFARELLQTADVGGKKVRLLGISISNLAGEAAIAHEQLALELGINCP